MFNLCLKINMQEHYLTRENFLKEIDIIKRKQTETLKLKSTAIKEILALGATRRQSGRRKTQQTQRDINRDYPVWGREGRKMNTVLTPLGQPMTRSFKNIKCKDLKDGSEDKCACYQAWRPETHNDGLNSRDPHDGKHWFLPIVLQFHKFAMGWAHIQINTHK